jgi:hypothetical protein
VTNALNSGIPCHAGPLSNPSRQSSFIPTGALVRGDLYCSNGPVVRDARTDSWLEVYSVAGPGLLGRGTRATDVAVWA